MSAMTDDESWFDEQHIRQAVRERLQFFRDVATFIIVTSFLALLDGVTGGGWWVQWVAIIWGGILALRFLGSVGASFWGRDVEDRMVEREMERRRRTQRM